MPLKKKSVWRDIVLTMGGGGKKKMSNVKLVEYTLFICYGL